MKFRAVMTELAAMRDFLGVANNLSRLAKICAMRIISNKVCFIISEEDGGLTNPFIWCELPVNLYFREYSLMGISEEHNEIYLLLQTGLLARSLAILKQNVKSVKIKLTNKQTPCITLEIEMIPENIQSRQYVHDIPVEVISRKFWNEYDEPGVNDFHISIELPSLRWIKNIVDRMKTLSSNITISGTKTGRFTLEISTDMVKLSSHFPDLTVTSFAVAEIEETEDSEQFNIHSTIEIKKLLTFLSAMQYNNCKITCSIVQNKMVKLHLEQSGLTAQCFLTQIST